MRATLAPAPSDARSRFRYQYLHLLLPCTIEVLAVLGEDVNSGLRQAPLRPGWKRFDFGLPVFLSLRKIVIELHLQPKLGRRVRHRLGKPHAHRRRNAGAAVEYPGEIRPR